MNSGLGSGWLTLINTAKELIPELIRLYKCPPLENRREAITVYVDPSEEAESLLVVYCNALELLALRIGSPRSDCAGFAIGRHANAPGDSDLSGFLDG